MKQTSALAAIPRGIWVLGLVSMLMDVSSEMIHALLPIYLIASLGASALTVGVIEGFAEATASVTKIFSGALSDWLGKRKLLAVIGYGLAAFSKPIFPLAPNVGWLFTARLIDRVGKGIRGAPRDALLADLAPPQLRGASFGLRQSLDTAGAFIGPTFAVLLMWATADAFRTVFWFAVLPAFLSFGLMAFAVKEPRRSPELRVVRAPLSRAEVARLGAPYWWIVAVATVFTLARFSEAFLILRARASGLPLTFVPVVLVLMNFVYAIGAYPAGRLSDRMERTRLLMLGLALLIAAYLCLVWAPGLPAVALGVVLWGLHMAFTQGILATLIADHAPPELRGTAFGFFNLMGGVAMLAASVLAGALWDAIGPAATFIAGAAFACLALLALTLIHSRLTRGRAG
jgi:MFS family permease